MALLATAWVHVASVYFVNTSWPVVDVPVEGCVNTALDHSLPALNVVPSLAVDAVVDNFDVKQLFTVMNVTPVETEHVASENCTRK